MGKKVCICVDASDFSEHAFNWYVKNFYQPDDTVLLLHVHQMPQLPSMGLMAGGIPITDSYRDSINKSVENSKKLIAKFKNLCAEQKVKWEVVEVESHHSPGEIICRAATEKGADAIVTGQRGLSNFSRTLLGSTSDYIVHHSEIPVLVVPPKRS